MFGLTVDLWLAWFWVWVGSCGCLLLVSVLAVFSGVVCFGVGGFWGVVISTPFCGGV